MGLGSAVWERTEGADEMSRGSYIAAVSNFTSYGIVLAAVVGYLTMSWQPSLVGFLLCGIAMPIAGIFIARGSDTWQISFAGYSMLVVGLGAIAGPTVALYETGVVMVALCATAGVTVTMSGVGVVFPRLLIHWGGYLFGALIALLLVRVAQMLMLSMGYGEAMPFAGLIEYFSALLFTLYIVYDWNRAVHLPHTMDNAVDCAMAIFLDVINLFFSLLRIFAGRN